MKKTTEPATPTTPEVAEQEVPDFYFTCSVLKCTMRASACAKNRFENAKVDSLMLKKQSTACKGCKAFEGDQKATAVSVEAYHASLVTPPKSTLYDHTAVKSGLHSDWAGRGRTRVRTS